MSLYQSDRTDLVRLRQILRDQRRRVAYAYHSRANASAALAAGGRTRLNARARIKTAETSIDQGEKLIIQVLALLAAFPSDDDIAVSHPDLID